MSVAWRIKKVKRWIYDVKRLQQTLIAKKIKERLCGSLIVVRNKTKMIQRQMRERLAEKKQQVAFMVRLFDTYLLKMVEVQK